MTDDRHHAPADGWAPAAGDFAGAPDPLHSRWWVVTALVIGAVLIVPSWPAHHPLLGAVEVIAGVAASLSLLAVAERPLLVAVFCAAMATVSPMGAVAALPAFAKVARTRTLRTYMLLGAGVVALVTLHVALHAAGISFFADQPNEILVLLPALAVGLQARHRLLREAAERHERDAQARIGERRRIAREMHDVLAHRISIVSVHAGALEVHPDAPAGEIANTASVIRSSAHAALGELREVVSVLRGAEGDAETLERPQPTLGDVPALVAEARAAGMRVRLDPLPADGPAVPDAVGRTVYRIVQEGLTNARKHAPAGEVEVELASRDATALSVSVLTRPASEDRVPSMAPPPGSGTGLVGLGERVALAGGRLDHGPTRDGAYALIATLPLPA